MNDPAVLFYTSDFLTGVMDMSMEERGMYITLLCYQHQKGHIEEKTIRFLLGYAKDNLPEVIMKHFKIDNEGKYYNERMDSEKDKRSKFVETRRKNGSKCGRPTQKKEKPLGKPSGKPLGKPRNNLMGNDNENENNNIYFNNKELNNLFLEYLELRTKIKCKNTDRAITLLVNELNKYDDETKIQMINNSIMNSWKSVYPIKNAKQNEIIPEWMNQEITEKEITKEEQEELNNILKEYK